MKNNNNKKGINYEKMRILIFLVLSLLLINCNKDEKKLEENNVEKPKVVETKEEEKPYQADAVIMIPYKNIGERIIILEHFLNKYPNSPTVELIKYFLDNYKDKDINAKIWKKVEN